MTDASTEFQEPFESSYDPSTFNQEAAGKLGEWERLLSDAGAAEQANLAALADMDDDQLTYLGELSYTPYQPKPKEE